MTFTIAVVGPTRTFFIWSSILASLLPLALTAVTGTTCAAGGDQDAVQASGFLTLAMQRVSGASGVQELDYNKVYEESRTYFGYESPLGEEHPHDIDKEWFQHSPMAFDFHESQQLKLWQEFIDAGYVKEGQRDLLKDRNYMYPELDKTFLFCFLQKIQPVRMLEIGSGESTEVARAALQAVARDGGRVCNHTAIEPYRTDAVPAGVSVIQQEMQELGAHAFDELEAGDVLFIDSSHIVKPYGDTLTELVSILPRLNKGVYVHIHDIFLPDDYPANWGLPDGIKNKVYTEQWAVKLLLDGSDEWEVIWSSHLMASRHPDMVMSMPHYPPAGTTFPAYRDGGPGRLNAALWLLKKGKPIRRGFENL